MKAACLQGAALKDKTSLSELQLRPGEFLVGVCPPFQLLNTFCFVTRSSRRLFVTGGPGDQEGMGWPITGPSCHIKCSSACCRSLCPSSPANGCHKAATSADRGHGSFSAEQPCCLALEFTLQNASGRIPCRHAPHQLSSAHAYSRVACQL